MLGLTKCFALLKRLTKERDPSLCRSINMGNFETNFKQIVSYWRGVGI